MRLVEEVLGTNLARAIALGGDESLEVAEGIITKLREVEGDDTIRSWFVGMNPGLDGWTPIGVLANSRVEDVQNVADHFFNNQGGGN